MRIHNEGEKVQLEMPEGIADNLWSIIVDCTRYKPGERPRVETLDAKLSTIAGSTALQNVETQ